MSCDFWLLNQNHLALVCLHPKSQDCTVGELHRGMEPRLKSNLFSPCPPYQTTYHGLKLHPPRGKGAIFFAQRWDKLSVFTPSSLPRGGCLFLIHNKTVQAGKLRPECTLSLIKKKHSSRSWASDTGSVAICRGFPHENSMSTLFLTS